MRSLFLALLLANLVFFAIQEDLFGNLLRVPREPERFATQIEPSRIKLIRGSTAATTTSGTGGDTRPVQSIAAVPPAQTDKPDIAACIELGGANGLTADDARRVGAQLAELELGSRVSESKSEDNAGFIVNLPPFKNKVEADRAATELRRIGVEDFFVIQDATPQKFGISLGVFKSEDAARAQLTALAQRGVRNARVTPRPPTAQHTWIQVRDVDATLAARLSDLRRSVPAAETRSCS